MHAGVYRLEVEKKVGNQNHWVSSYEVNFPTILKPPETPYQASRGSRGFHTPTGPVEANHS